MGAQASCLPASIATNVEAGKDAYAPNGRIDNGSGSVTVSVSWASPPAPAVRPYQQVELRLPY